MNNIDNELDNQNNLSITLFNLIKEKKWDSLMKIININNQKNLNFDYNIKDITNTYFIEYLIIFNQSNIIKEVFKNNIRIDIIDENGKTLLYNVIKYSYIEIFDLLIEKNNNEIGQNILELKDSEQNIPLFYAIKFYNILLIEKIIKNMNNFLITNDIGDNVLFVSIKAQNIEIFKIILNKIKKINFINGNGETIFHVFIRLKCYDMFQYIIDFIDKEIIIKILNIPEKKFNLTILHYIAIYLEDFFLTSLSTKNYLQYLKPNIQDKNGNTFYHYFLNNIININVLNWDQIITIQNINTIFFKLNFNLDLYNIFGNTVTHLLVTDIKIFIENKLNILINEIISKSNLNIQNNDGDWSLFLLIKNNYWINIENILVNKKLDIFLLNNNNKSIFDYIRKDEYNNFLQLITQSYINLLDKNKWDDKIDNLCSKKINLITKEEKILLEKLEKNIILDIVDKYNINDKLNNICFITIKKKLEIGIENFKKNKNRYITTSFPSNYKVIKLIKNYPNVELSTFTGSTLDVLFGLIYLSLKYHNKFNYIDSSLKLIDFNLSIINCNSIDYRTQNKICEIVGFEILWKNNILYIPSNQKLDLYIEINYAISNKYNFFIIPIGIESVTNTNICSHSNYLIWDLIRKEVERFEPHGAEQPEGMNYNSKLLDESLENKILSYNLNFKYIKPFEYLPKIGFQIKEINELQNNYIGDPNGFCALWCIWWVDLRLENPTISREELFNLLNTEIISEKYTYKKLIRDYSFFITELRDKFLSKADTNINQWINDKINQTKINLLQNLIVDQIITLF